MAKLHWDVLYDEHDNVYLEAESPYQDDGVHFLWRLRKRLRHDRLEWHNASADEVCSTVCGTFWILERDARAAIQKAHDKILGEMTAAQSANP